MLKNQKVYQYFVLIKFHKYRNSECFACRDIFDKYSQFFSISNLIPTHSHNTRHIAHNNFNTVPYANNVRQCSFLLDANQFLERITYPPQILT